MFSPWQKMKKSRQASVIESEIHLFSHDSLCFKVHGIFSSRNFIRLIIFTIWLMMVAIGVEYQNDANSKITFASIETSGNEKMLSESDNHAGKCVPLICFWCWIIFTKISKFNFMMNVNNNFLDERKTCENSVNSVCYHVIVNFVILNFIFETF